MNHFVNIHFLEHENFKIKEKDFKRKGAILKLRWLPAYLEEEQVVGHKGYNLYILKEKKSLSKYFWRQLEHDLLKKGINYCTSNQWQDNFFIQHNPFTQIQAITGERILFLLSNSILEYIFRYNLIQKDKKYAKIGVVVGNKKDTLDLIGPILQSITDLTLFCEKPLEYKEFIQEIYENARIKTKIFRPSQKILSQMDIVFDVQKGKSYVNDCSPKGIYIDFYQNTLRTKIKLNPLTPIIWYDFDILLENHEITKPLLEAILYQRGCSPRSLRRKIMDQKINIKSVYARL
jgi:hypothetical protein